MSKKKKKNKKKSQVDIMADFWGTSTPPLAKEGDLRFFQQRVRGGGDKFWSGDCKIKHDGKKVLQQFHDGEWEDIPFDTETIWVD